MYNLAEYFVLCIILVLLGCCCLNCTPYFFVCLVECYIHLLQTAEQRRDKKNRRRVMQCVVVYNTPVATETDRIQHSLCRVVPDAVVV